jgi:HSP20 family protein
MADRSSKLPVPTEKSSPGAPQEWQPLERLWREIDRLFEDFGGGFFRGSLFDADQFGDGKSALPTMPAVDVTETDKAYQITAQLPGMDEKSVEVKLTDGVLSISGEKQDEKREKNKDYYMQQRSFGSFQRSFTIPDDVDANKIEATFKGGILSVRLSKTDPQMAPKRIPGGSFNI